MKRPRGPVKKIARKAVRKKRQTKAQKAAQAEAVLRASLRKVDPFYLDPKLIPVGWDYQWKIEGGGLLRGWSPVPFSRHAHDFPRSFQSVDCIVHDGLILCEALADQVASELYVPRQQALKDRKAGIHDALGITVHGFEGRMPIADEGWLETEKLGDLPPQDGPPVLVQIVLPVKVPARWMHAAAYLKIEHWEYVRRRILLERPVLGMTDPHGETFEMVLLQFSPVSKEPE